MVPARRTADPADPPIRDGLRRRGQSGRGDASCAGGTGSIVTRRRGARALSSGSATTPRPWSQPSARLPSLGLHGDIKLANVALFEDGGVGFIDWQMTLRAPVAVELGWFLVTNSAELPLPPDEILRRYHRSLGGYAGRWRSGARRHDLDGLVGDWAAQVDLAAIVGLLLRGWRKGRDTDDGAILGSGIPADADLRGGAIERSTRADRRLVARRRQDDAEDRSHPRWDRAQQPAVQQGRRGERPGVPGRPGRRCPGTSGAVPGGIEAETRQMLENVGSLLHAAGLDYGDVVKATVYLRDFADFAAMNTVYREFFPSEPPTRATVGVTALAADYRVEIEVIATR